MNDKYIWKSLYKYNLILFIIFIIFLVSVIFGLNWLILNYKCGETFIDIVNKDIVYEKDRTLLYGSLFLDKLNEQIKNMTDPRIQYNDKQIEIIKYSDVLL